MDTVQSQPFSKRDLTKMMIPLIVEQFLLVTVGLADSMMVAGLGEAAVSGVSLVDTVTLLLTNLIGYLTAGSAIVVGQYLGARKIEKACHSAEQMLLFAVTVAIVFTGIIFALRNTIIYGLFGAIEPAVAENAVRYFNIVELSIIPLAFYMVGASLFRIMGNTKVTMLVSVFVNLFNVTGNAVLIYGAKMGVEGAALPTLCSRIFGALLILYLIGKSNGPIHLTYSFPPRFEGKAILQIVKTGVPNAIEGSVFQMGKILLASVVAAFGTSAITANAIGNTVSTFQSLPASATCLAMTSVVSICVGRGLYDAVGSYIKKLMKFAYIGDLAVNVIIMLLLKVILRLYNVSPETEGLARAILVSFAAVTLVLWPLSFTFPNALRAAGDTRFVMTVSIVSMLGLRLVLGIILAKTVGWGVLGVWIAMYVDWTFRSICFILRYRSGKWKSKAVVC